MLISAVVYAARRTLNAEAVEVLGLYWHFVDIVWVVIFAIVYLIP
jgi:heme/copper-type cytochrome/quinol oxidase subunit 3